MHRRNFSRALVAFSALPLLAQAQPLSSRPIRIVVPFGAGGVADLTIRSVAQKMTESMGQSIVIENKPGAGGVVAADTVAKAAPDGHTLFLMSNGTAVTAGLFKSLPYDTVNDFAPVSTLGFFDLAVLVAGRADVLQLWSLSGDLADLAGCPVDLIDLRAASTVMQYQVITTGQRWWALDSQAALWEAAVLSDKTELDEARRPLLEDIAREGRIHGR